MNTNWDKNEEDKVFDALRQNDETVFEELFRRYWPRLYSYSLRFTKDDEAARDIIQDCFVKLWEKRHSLSSVSFRSLIFTMVRNACLNYVKHKVVVDRYGVVSLSEKTGGELLYDVDFGRYSDCGTIYSELVAQINDVLGKLPERTQEIFRMSRFEGLKNREISEQLGISTTAVEKHISRALKALGYLNDRVYLLFL